MKARTLSVVSLADEVREAATEVVAVVAAVVETVLERIKPKISSPIAKQLKKNLKLIEFLMSRNLTKNAVKTPSNVVVDSARPSVAPPPCWAQLKQSWLPVTAWTIQESTRTA